MAYFSYLVVLRIYNTQWNQFILFWIKLMFHQKKETGDDYIKATTKYSISILASQWFSYFKSCLYHTKILFLTYFNTSSHEVALVRNALYAINLAPSMAKIIWTTPLLPQVTKAEAWICFRWITQVGTQIYGQCSKKLSVSLEKGA